MSHLFDLSSYYKLLDTIKDGNEELDEVTKEEAQENYNDMKLEQLKLYINTFNRDGSKVNNLEESSPIDRKHSHFSREISNRMLIRSNTSSSMIDQRS